MSVLKITSEYQAQGEIFKQEVTFLKISPFLFVWKMARIHDTMPRGCDVVAAPTMASINELYS
jgi:hypothetical protein